MLEGKQPAGKPRSALLPSMQSHVMSRDPGCHVYWSQQPHAGETVRDTAPALLMNHNHVWEVVWARMSFGVESLLALHPTETTETHVPS